MSFKEDRAIETLGDNALGWERRRHRHHHHRRPGQMGPGTPGAPGTPYGAPYGTSTPYGAPAATTAPAPAGQPYPGAIPIQPGNWPGGTYPPPGWQAGQPLPGYPQGWPPPGSAWPGTYAGSPGAPAVQLDPYGNPVVSPTTYNPYANPYQSSYNPYANYVPPSPPQQTNGPQPTIDVTVGAAIDRGVPMSAIVGALRKRGYSGREVSAIIGMCCGI